MLSGLFLVLLVGGCLIITVGAVVTSLRSWSQAEDCLSMYLRHREYAESAETVLLAIHREHELRDSCFVCGYDEIERVGHQDPCLMDDWLKTYRGRIVWAKYKKNENR